MLLKGIFTLFTGVFFSRILGLLRESLMVAFLGVSEWTSAFILAFTLPNLFRNLLGEGALTSAIVPVLSEVLAIKGKKSFFELLNVIFLKLLKMSFYMIVITIPVLLIIQYLPNLSNRWYLSGKLSAILMSYMPMVCFAAIASATLTIVNHFRTSGILAVILNLSMIASLFVGKFLNNPEKQVYILCLGVLLGGVLQCVLPILQLFKKGWNLSIPKTEPREMKTITNLFIPGVFGAAVFQINTAIGRLIAFSIDNQSVSFLYLANRFISLPLGLFVFAITTAIFPSLSTSVAKKEWQKVNSDYNHGLISILGITIPAGVGISLLSKQIISLCFEWGKFSANDTSVASSIFLVFAISLPFLAQASFVTRAFHAMQDTKTVAKITFRGLILNVVLSFLFYKLGGIGLAFASTLSSVYQSIILQKSINVKQSAFKCHDFWRKVGIILLSAFFMAIACKISLVFVEKFIVQFSPKFVSVFSNIFKISITSFSHKIIDLIQILIGIISAIFIYLLSLLLIVRFTYDKNVIKKLIGYLKNKI